MAIVHCPPPHVGPAALRRPLQRLVDGGALGRLVPGVAPETLQATEPHPVYTIALDDVRAGKLVEAAVHTSWRYLLTSGGRAHAAAEHTADPQAAEPGVHVTVGPHVQGTLDAVHAALALPEVGAADYELRVLRVPALYFVALWLHGPEELFVPIVAAGPHLASATPYRERDVLDALRDAASSLPNPVP